MIEQTVLQFYILAFVSGFALGLCFGFLLRMFIAFVRWMI